MNEKKLFYMGMTDKELKNDFKLFHKTADKMGYKPYLIKEARRRGLTLK